MDDDVLQKLVARAISYISFRPRSSKEIHAYLVKRVRFIKQGQAEYIQKAEERLSELRYIDDAMYAKLFVESRSKSRPKAKKLIALELKNKGVSEDIIASLPSEGPSDLEIARALAYKKYSNIKKYPQLEQKRKLFGLLKRRGFDSDVVYRVIDELIELGVQ